MALKLLHTAGTPLGEFDALDTDLAAGFLGGDFATWTSIGSSVGDKSAADAQDGYLNPNIVTATPLTVTGTGAKRTVLSKSAILTGTTSLMLVDDGLAGYGVLFGVVTGGTAGQTSFGAGQGSPLGPATYVGSGKLTVWATAGLFGTTLDAVDTSTTTGVVSANQALAAGTPLYAGVTGATQGLLTTALGSNTNKTTKSVGTFVDFETNRALVTTPNRLVQALNSPSSTVSGTLPNQLTMAVFSYTP